MTEMTIRDNAFRDRKLRSITTSMLTSITTIGDSAFRDCTSLRTVTIPDSVTTIGDNAFRRCTSLRSVTIESTSTAIGRCAFRDCTSLRCVTIPHSVTKIGENAFRGCTSLRSVTIESTSTAIGTCAFSKCSKLKSVTVHYVGYELDSQRYTAEKQECIVRALVEQTRSLYSGSTRTEVFALNPHQLLLFTKASGMVVRSLIIPESVTTIGSCECVTSLRFVHIPDSVTTIGDNAFRGCTSLRSVHIPDSVTKIGNEAFGECTSLRSVTLRSLTSDHIQIDSVPDNAFQGCTSLTHMERYGLHRGYLFSPVSSVRCEADYVESCIMLLSSAYTDIIDDVFEALQIFFNERHMEEINGVNGAHIAKWLMQLQSLVASTLAGEDVYKKEVYEREKEHYLRQKKPRCDCIRELDEKVKRKWKERIQSMVLRAATKLTDTSKKRIMDNKDTFPHYLSLCSTGRAGRSTGSRVGGEELKKLLNRIKNQKLIDFDIDFQMFPDWIQNHPKVLVPVLKLAEGHNYLSKGSGVADEQDFLKFINGLDVLSEITSISKLGAGGYASVYSVDRDACSDQVSRAAMRVSYGKTLREVKRLICGELMQTELSNCDEAAPKIYEGVTVFDGVWYTRVTIMERCDPPVRQIKDIIEHEDALEAFLERTSLLFSYVHTMFDVTLVDRKLGNTVGGGAAQCLYEIPRECA